MASRKSNINNISDDTRSLVKDHLKLFSIRQTQKLSRFFGLLSTIFIISIILLIVIIFFSFAIAGFLNNMLNTDIGGYLIVSGLYILVILVILIRMRKTKRPLLSNAIARSLASVFEVESKHSLDLDGLEIEKEIVQEKINTNKEKINTGLQLLRYSLIEQFFEELFKIFSKKKEPSDKEDNEPEPGSQS